MISVFLLNLLYFFQFLSADFPINLGTIDNSIILLRFIVFCVPIIFFDCSLFFVQFFFFLICLIIFFVSPKWKVRFNLSLLPFSHFDARTIWADANRMKWSLSLDLIVFAFRKILCLSFPIDGLPAVICDMCRCVSSANFGNNKLVRKWYNDTLPGVRHACRQCVALVKPSNTAPYHTVDTKTISSANILKSNIDTAQGSKYTQN